MSLRVIAILLVRAKKLVSVEDAPFAPLRGEDKCPRMLMALSLMENSCDRASNEKSSHCGHQRAMNDTRCTFVRCAAGEDSINAVVGVCSLLAQCVVFRGTRVWIS